MVGCIVFHISYHLYIVSFIAGFLDELTFLSPRRKKFHFFVGSNHFHVGLILTIVIKKRKDNACCHQDRNATTETHWYPVKMSDHMQKQLSGLLGHPHHLVFHVPSLNGIIFYVSRFVLVVILTKIPFTTHLVTLFSSISKLLKNQRPLSLTQQS